VSKYLKVQAIGRFEPVRKCLVIHFNHEPTDDQKREFWDWCNDFKTVEETVAKGFARDAATEQEKR
jgi:hypothetical protein